MLLDVRSSQPQPVHAWFHMFQICLLIDSHTSHMNIWAHHQVHDGCSELRRSGSCLLCIHIKTNDTSVSGICLCNCAWRAHHSTPWIFCLHMFASRMTFLKESPIQNKMLAMGHYLFSFVLPLSRCRGRRRICMSMSRFEDVMLSNSSADSNGSERGGQVLICPSNI